MLVITRKTGEELAIGSEITLKVLEIKSGKVVLGVNAPAELQVRRVSENVSKGTADTVSGSLSSYGKQKNS